jgi:hypothetical protein
MGRIMPILTIAIHLFKLIMLVIEVHSETSNPSCSSLVAIYFYMEAGIKR